MDFVGQGRPLGANDVKVIAGYLGCEIAAIRAVLAVEAAGKGFGPDKRPIILNEPHVFYRELSGQKRTDAARAGLAYSKWGSKPYPKTQSARYQWLSKAMKIDESAALKSCSWGLGQVMGFNHKLCGFSTVQQFVEAMKYSEGAQLYAVARFIVSRGLTKYLRAKNWAAFAKGYNGAGYAKNAYHTKLASAYAKRPKSERVVPPPATEAEIKALLGGAAPVSTAPIVKVAKPASPVVTGVAAGVATKAAGFPWGDVIIVGIAIAIVVLAFVYRDKIHKFIKGLI